MRFQPTRVLRGCAPGLIFVLAGLAVSPAHGQAPAPGGSSGSATEAKLDEILRTLQELKSENQRMSEELRQIRALLPAGTPRPEEVVRVQAEPQPQLTPPAGTQGQGRDVLWRVPDERLDPGPVPQSRRFSLLSLNAGPDRRGNLSLSGRGRYFAHFGDSHAVQVEGEFLHFGGPGIEGRQEGQFDVGLVNRWRNIQAGGFASFRHLSLEQYQNGGTLGQAAFTLDFVFAGGRAGFFGTKGFMNEAVLNRANLGPTSYLETYARVVDQAGISTQIGLWRTAYVESNLSALWRPGGGHGAGGMVRLVQPVSRQVALTFEGGWNESLVQARNNSRFAVGVQFGSWIFPKDYKLSGRPVPVDIPRIRYDLLTRRVGNSSPVADAGPDQLAAAAGVITLDGSGSRDPDGDPLQYEWLQTGGPSVSITGRNSAKATFTAAEGQRYSFQLKVTDPEGMWDTDRVEVAVAAAPKVRIIKFMAQPNVIRAGQGVTLIWETEQAESVEITSIGQVAASGTTTVAPVATTVYQLTARNRTGEVSETVTVQVERAELRILRFYATPTNIKPGESSNLIWAVENADSVEIDTLGPISPDGSSTVSPGETTSYVLTARKGNETVSARTTVSVAPGNAPKIIRFSGTPPEIAAGEAADLTWEVQGATEVRIEPELGTAGLNGIHTVRPLQNTTYTLVATNEFGTSRASVVISVFDPVRILDFTSTPSVIMQGETAKLAWKTENATSAVITGIGPVPVNGTVEVKPGEATSYTLVAYGKRGNVSAFVLLKVIRPLEDANPVCVVGPDQTLMEFRANLDGSKSYHPAGLTLSYNWRFVSFTKDPSLPPATGPTIPYIFSPNSAVTGIKMSVWGTYEFEFTARDGNGRTCTATSRVTYIDP